MEKIKDKKYYLKQILFELIVLGCTYVGLPIPCIPYIFFIGLVSSVTIMRVAIGWLVLFVLYVLFAILYHKNEKYRIPFSIISTIPFATLIILCRGIFAENFNNIIPLSLFSLRILIFLTHTIALILTINKSKALVIFNAIFGSLLVICSFNPIEILYGIILLMKTNNYSKLIEDDEESEEVN